jgi:exopolysaccharide biosynthesis polyprenyl glycosylphosphotransferase
MATVGVARGEEPFAGSRRAGHLRRGGVVAPVSLFDVIFSAIALAMGAIIGIERGPVGVVASVTIAAVTVAGIKIRQRVRTLSGGLYDDLVLILGAATTAVVAGCIVQVVGAAGSSSARVGPLLGFAALEVGSLTAGRVLLNTLRAQLMPPVPTLIIGAGHIGRLLGRRLVDHPQLGLQPIGFLDKDPLDDGSTGLVDLPVLGASWDLERIVRSHNVGYVIVTFSTAPTEVLLSLLQRCDALGLDVALVPRLFERVPRRIAVHHLGGVPLLQIKPANPHGLAFELKHILDRVGAAILLPLLAPALLLSALGVWLSLGRPIFFRQRRIGRDSKPFDMLKFRTMAAPSETPIGHDGLLCQNGLAPGGVEGADRRTRVGATLRRTSLDELPQLLNVLKGEMSFIGPRPERPEFVKIFNEGVYRYDDRHRVKAGITGWSQVNGLRGKTSIQDRAEWDNYYIENWSFGMDFRILASTIRAMFASSATE